MRRLVRVVITFLFLVFFSGIAFAAYEGTPDNTAAEDGTVDDLGAKARRAHDMAASDVMYQQEDFRALYYQNQQIIALLGEVRDGLQNLQKQQASKAENKG